MNLVTMRAIFKRDLAGFFGSLVGYLFVLAFVVLSALALIRPGDLEGDFFATNQANLDLLTEWFPLLVALFVPLMAMASWAKETDHGTSELLFTLPARDHELVLAKFAACFGTYTIALGFTSSLVVMLKVLGNPDMGLLFATYLGYWLLGGAAMALAMIGSCLTRNIAVAWLLGFFFCLAPAAPTAFFDPRGTLVELSALQRFASFGTGVIAFEDVIYFVGLTAFGLYANTFLLGRRHWTMNRERIVHEGIRLGSIALGVASLAVWVGHWAVRRDVTAEQMLSLTDESRQVLDRLSEGEGDAKLPPVFVHAWVSPEVPEDYLATREGLLHMLREFDAAGGDQIQVAVYDTELYSKEAQEAEERFGIKPVPVQMTSGGRHLRDDIFMGLAFTCGPRELKIPFFDKGLPIQYELTRAIGAVAQVERAKIGILKSAVDLFGGFDFQNMSRSDDWKVLGDLRKQYDVNKVEGTAAIDTSLDVLVVPLPSSLTQDKMDRVAEYLWSGGKALFFCDPYPMFDLSKAPLQQPGAGRNPFQQQQRQPEGPKGSIEALMAALGVTWAKDQVVWDDYNPHPEWEMPRELTFVAPAGSDRASGFNEEDPITSGLQEMVTLYAGFIEAAPSSDVTFTPLLKTGTHSGRHHWTDMVEVSFFGTRPKPDEMRRYDSQGIQQVLAARVQGKLRGTADSGAMKRGQLSEKPFEAIVVADMDVVSDVFYGLRAQGSADFNLDNVTFVANCIDALAGDDSYIALRKLRPAHRTLTYFEAIEAEQDEIVRKETKRAKDQSQEHLDAAQKRLDDAVAQIQNRTDVDPRQKRILVEAKRQEESRRLSEAEDRIKDEERTAIRLSETRKQQRIKSVQNLVTYSVLGLTPLPAVLLGLFVLFRKLSREQAGIDPARRRS